MLAAAALRVPFPSPVSGFAALSTTTTNINTIMKKCVGAGGGGYGQNNLFSSASLTFPATTTTTIGNRRSLSLLSTPDDNGGGEDWFSDYDESEYNKSGGGGGASYGGGGYRGSPPRENRGGGGGNSDYYNHGRDGGHDYTRDTSRDTSNVDEDAVNRLLSERIGAKRERDYDTADAIRDQLASDYGVAVFDRELTWRTGWTSGGGTRRGGGGNDRRGGGRNSRRPAVDFGPNGHDYHRSSDMGENSSDLEESDIHAMLAERLEAKLGRQFHIADRIQADLIAGGVYVHDGRKEWRADGVAFGDLKSSDGRGPGRTAGSRSTRSYTKSAHSPQVPDDKESLVTALVNERQKFKEVREYEKADAIREGLRTKFNVLIDDKLKQWSVGGFFGAEHQAQREMMEAFNQRGYVKSGSSKPLPAEDEEYIQAKIDERQEAKRDRDFDTADRIREALEAKYDLMVNDKMKMWSIGGDFGADGGPRKPRGAYTRRGGGDLSEEDLETITKLLAERFNAKKARDFYTSDDIRDRLRTDYNIVIDDKSNEWHVVNENYVQAKVPGGAELDDEQVEKITALIEERKQCKAARQYDRADAIRDELTGDFYVVLDDRTKEWKYAPPAAPAEESSPVADEKVVEEGW